MRFIIELDGPVFDISKTQYAAYGEAAGEVGWSRLDQPTYWRLVRTRGREADILSGAGASKVDRFQHFFDSHAESDAILEKLAPQEGVRRTLAALSRRGECTAVTLGTNLGARKVVLGRSGLEGFFSRIVSLDTNPRRRPDQLRRAAEGDARTMVVASSDSVIRAAGAAELFSVGLSCGSCSIPRLHRAGPGVVYKALAELGASLEAGAKDLVRAGLLPPGLG